MYERAIKADEVKHALLKCEIVEDYPEDRPFPSYLVIGRTKKRRPLHIVVAIDYKGPMLWIITIYEPTLKEWEKGFKKRRQK